MNVSFCVAAFAWRPGTFLISHAKQMTLERWREKEIRSDAAYLSVLHRIFCLSFCPRPRYNLCCSFLEKLTHMHTHMHTHIHTHIHTYIHAYIHTCVHTYIHTYTYTYTHTHTHTHTTLSHTTVSPLPLSFLPSPSPLQPLVLIIGRS